MMEKLRKISKMYYLKQILACWLVSCMLFAIPTQVARAATPVYTDAGGATITQNGDTNVLVNQPQTIIEWSNFNTVDNELVAFEQGSLINSAVLNKISGSQTLFNGDLTGEGMRIFLINPSGIIFGPTATVNVAQLVASGLNMADQDFLDFTDGTITEMKFQGGLGIVTNEGTINAASSAYLVGTQVTNAGTGTINSPIVVLAAGEKVFLNHSGSNVYIEVASDLETPVPADNTVDNYGTINATGQVLLAAGDILSTAISGVGKLAAVANRNVDLGGDFEAGEITLTADADGVDGGRVYAGGIVPGDALTSTTGDIEISASDDTKIQLNNVDIDAAEDLLLNNNTTVSPGKTLKAGQDVILADSKTMLGYGDLTVEGDRDIILGGDVLAYGTLTLKADADTVDNEPGATTGGIMWAKSTLRTIFGNGNIDIYGNAILLDNHVTADGDLILNDNTIVKDTGNPGVKLMAGNNVNSKSDLIAKGNLTIEATGGEIIAKRIDMDSVGSTLTLKQNNKLDLEENIEEWDGRINTHLVAQSTADSITSIAAAKWLDITATADENITLSDESGDITTLQLTATNGDVKINANDGKLFAEGTISAGRDVKITATDEGSDAIFLYDNVDAGRDIWLNNNTWAADGVEIDAGRDLRVGWDETHERYDPKTLTGDGNLTITAGDNMTFGGDILIDGDLYLYADNPAVDIDGDDDVGDVLAKGSVTTTNSDLWIEGENIQIDGAINIAGNIDIFAEENITLGSNAEADGYIELLADFDFYGMGFPEDETGDLSTKSLTTGGDLIYAYGQNIDVDGTVDSGGYLWMTAADDITLHDTVTANGYIWLEADYVDDDTGLMWAKSSITNTSGTYTLGNLDVYGEDIQIDGVVDIGGNITMDADDDLTLASNVEAGGNIDLYSSDDTTYLGGDLVKASGDLTLHNNTVLNGTDDLTTPEDESDQRIEATTGLLTAMKDVDKSTEGSMTLAGGNSIILSGDVTGSGMTVDDKLVFEDNVTANGTGDAKDQRFDAGLGTLDADMSIVKTTAGNLNLAGEAGIELGGNVLGAGLFSADDTITFENDVTADGGSQILDAGSGTLDADGNIEKTTAGSLNLGGEAGILLSGDVITNLTGSDLTFENAVTADGDTHQKFQAGSSLIAYSTITKEDGGDPGIDLDGGNLTLKGGQVNISGDVVVEDGTLTVEADSDIELRENVSSKGEMAMDAGDEIIIGDAFADDGNVTANSNIRIWAGGDWNDDVIVYGKLTTTDGGSIDIRAGDDINIYGTWNGDPAVYESVYADGALTMSSNTSGVGFLGGDLYIAGETIAESMILEAGVVGDDGEGSPDGAPGYSDSRVQVDGLLQTTGGDMVVRAHHDVLLGGNVVSAGNLVLNADRHGSEHNGHIYGGDVDVVGTVDAVGTIDMYGNNITLQDNVTSGGDMTLTANTSSDFKDEFPVGDVEAMGNLESINGSITISSDNLTTYLGGDVTAAVNVTLNNNTVFTSDVDQKVDAQTGMITANGSLLKPLESLYLEAAGNVSLADSVIAEAGGVSIISENGKIFTPDELGDPTDTLNVPITGYSDQRTGAGVNLNPDMDNKAAIVIKSKEDLKLGEGTVLTASGLYGGVDDRAAVGLLDTDGTSIGGFLRDEGEPIDIAIYLASTEGDVDFSGSASIESDDMIFDGPINGNTSYNGDYEPRPEFEPQRTMVIDAYDTVTLGDFGETPESQDRFIDVGRLEVVSRITEWLFQAVGRLPFVYDPAAIAAFEEFIGGDYILRGAGLDNPDITDGRAWVLEDPTPPAPLYEEAGQTAERLTIGLEGCPVLVAAASAELGIPEDTIQVSLANSFALNTNIQPCESCARLLNAAEILSDEDGSGMAALNQVFNELAPANVAFTPEVAASIVTAFAGRVGDGTQYATAIDYIDAFVRYIAVLDAELGSPVGDGDSVAFVMEKYGSGITENENSNIAAFIATRLESGETFGE